MDYINWDSRTLQKDQIIKFKAENAFAAIEEITWHMRGRDRARANLTDPKKKRKKNTTTNSTTTMKLAWK